MCSSPYHLIRIVGPMWRRCFVIVVDFSWNHTPTDECAHGSNVDEESILHDLGTYPIEHFSPERPPADGSVVKCVVGPTSAWYYLAFGGRVVLKNSNNVVV